MRIPSTRTLEALVAVARFGTLASAGAELGLSIPALSRRIADLERELGARLFERHPRGLTLTPAGETYHAQVVAALHLLRGAGSTVRRMDRDVVRLTTIPAFAIRWLLPRLPRFASTHPDIEVEVRTSLPYEDLDAQDIDVAVRLAPDERRIGAELVPIHLMPVWSPDHFRPVCDPAALRNVTLLSPDHRPEFWREWMEHHDLVPEDARVRHVDPLLLYELALAGAGVAIGIDPLTTDLLEDGRLDGMRSHRLRSSRSFRLLTRQHCRTRSATRFCDWLQQQAEAAGVAD